MSDFDFKGVAPAASRSYLKPGQYVLNITKAEFVEKDNKTPYVEVTLSTKSGGSVSEKFYITPKAINRLQYLHNAWFNKPVEKAFGKASEVGAYFEKALTSDAVKKISKKTKVNGQEAEDGKVYAGLPYTDFVIDDNVPFEEMEYEPGTPRYNEAVKKSQPTRATGRGETVLSDDLPSLPSTEDNKMPWED